MLGSVGKCANCQGPFSYRSESQIGRKCSSFTQVLFTYSTSKAGRLMGRSFQGKITANPMNQEGRALCRYGDAGWGTLVKKESMKLVCLMMNW